MYEHDENPKETSSSLVNENEDQISFKTAIRVHEWFRHRSRWKWITIEKGICTKSLAKCYLFLLQSSVTREKRARGGKQEERDCGGSFDLRDLPLLTPLRLMVPPTLQNVISREK